jgi:cyclopropane fatty-acyl-phospholipid synthase-like methyltransferase
VSGDRAGEQYWSKLWSESDLPRAVDPTDRSLRNHLRRRFVRYFDQHLVTTRGPSVELLEVGCARSVWPVYFARAYGMRVAGLDYSAVGCEQSRAMFARDGVEGEVVQGDLFAPPEALLGRFEYVLSFGVVEHFEDTTTALASMARLLKPGGRMCTFIPNQVGVMGAVQKRLDRRFFDMHVPLDEPALRRAHESAGLRVLDSRYFMATNFGVLNHSTYATGSAAARVRAVARQVFVALSAAAWLLEDTVGIELPATRAFSPYAACIAAKPV